MLLDICEQVRYELISLELCSERDCSNRWACNVLNAWKFRRAATKGQTEDYICRT